MKTICIMCPVGCSLDIEEKNGEIKVFGNNCIRGKTYGEDEIRSPKRIITTIVKLENSTASVKTTKPIPKDKIQDCLKEIAKLNLKSVKMGEIVIQNILNCDADIVVTGVFEN